jgi:hypothetical protein
MLEPDFWYEQGYSDAIDRPEFQTYFRGDWDYDENGKAYRMGWKDGEGDANSDSD